MRSVAASLAWVVGFGPMTPSAFAALTKLADEPLNVKNSAEPNIVLTLDDSTSMLSDFLPELVVDNYCRDSSGIMQAACGKRPAVAADARLVPDPDRIAALIRDEYDRLAPPAPR